MQPGSCAKLRSSGPPLFHVLHFFCDLFLIWASVPILIETDHLRDVLSSINNLHSRLNLPYYNVKELESLLRSMLCLMMRTESRLDNKTFITRDKFSVSNYTFLFINNSTGLLLVVWDHLIKTIIMRSSSDRHCPFHSPSRLAISLQNSPLRHKSTWVWVMPLVINYVQCHPSGIANPL